MEYGIDIMGRKLLKRSLAGALTIGSFSAALYRFKRECRTDGGLDKIGMDRMEYGMDIMGRRLLKKPLAETLTIGSFSVALYQFKRECRTDGGFDRIGADVILWFRLEIF